jgi:anti-sigma factor RsiW
MSHDVQIDELLSAYISGDVTPAERVAVDARLASDSAYRRQLNELTALHGLLKQAQLPVTAKMLVELQRRVMQNTGTPITALLSASLSSDLDSNERAKLDQYLAQNPAARSELASLNAMSAFLKQGERPVPANAMRSLAERLSAKIPAGALAPVLPKADETVAIKLQTSAPAPTVRIYATQESPWRKRILRAAAAIAAAIALSAGTIFGLRALKSSDEVAKENLPKSPVDHHAREVVRDVEPAPSPMPMPRETPDVKSPDTSPEIPQPNRAPTPPSTIQIPDKTPALPIGQAAPAPDVLRTPSDVKTPRTPKTSIAQPANVEPTVPAAEPAHSPDPQPALDPDEKTVVDKNTTNKGGVPFIQQGNVLPSNGPVVAQGPTVPPVATQSTNPANPTPNASVTPTPDATSPVDNSFVAAVDGKMIVAVLRDGTDAQSTTAAGLKTVQLKDELPSDTSITTGNTRLALVLPGDGRLWINRHSSISVQLRGLNTVVNIDSGEVSYRAPNNGNVTVTHPSGVQADSQGLMDVNVDDTSKTLTAAAILVPAKVGRKGKGLKTVPVKSKAVEKLDNTSTDASVVAGPDSVLLWQQDLRVNGEGADGLPITTTSKKEGRQRK